MSREEEDNEEEEGIRLMQKDRRVCYLGVSQVLMLLRDEGTESSLCLCLPEGHRRFSVEEGNT